jgi:hypothetical protein
MDFAPDIRLPYDAVGHRAEYEPSTAWVRCSGSTSRSFASGMRTRALRHNTSGGCWPG